MTAAVGQAALQLGLLVAAFGATASALAAGRRGRRLATLARVSAFAVLPAAALAAGALEVALLRHDFSVSYVAENGSRATPTFFTAISLWGALEGSVLLWLLVLGGYIAVIAALAPRRVPELWPTAQAVLLAVAAFFFWLASGPASPFRAVTLIPVDGPGPNPLLQNHALMAVHPPALYLGLVGFTVPFAFAIAALVTGRLDEEWIRVSRGATMVAWAFLSLGVVLGGWWSYEVLGWGGYWAWDPVENVSVLPWLTATAYVHSLQVHEKRGMLKLWSLTLLVATFALTLLATFLTRSGVLSSVHAFADGLAGPALLAFIALAVGGSAVLLAWRGERLRSEGTLDTLVCRESALLVNNLLLVVLTLTVLVGTLFPLVAEAVSGARLSVGEPYFNQTAVPIAIALLFLMGVGPALPWRRAAGPVLRRRLVAPGLGALVVAGVLPVVGVRRPDAVVVLVLASFVALQVLWDLGRIAARGSLARQRRRVGGQLVHAGIAVLAVGIAVSSIYRTETEATLSRGQALRVGGRVVTFAGAEVERQPHRRVVRAELLLDGRERLAPALNFYGAQRDATASPAISTGLDRDLYTVLTWASRDGSRATVRIFVEPLVTWIWIGGGIVLAGAAVAGAPGLRRAAG